MHGIPVCGIGERSASRDIERAAMSRSVAMKFTGHKTESVYRRYAIADDRDLRGH